VAGTANSTSVIGVELLAALDQGGIMVPLGAAVGAGWLGTPDVSRQDAGTEGGGSGLLPYVWSYPTCCRSGRRPAVDIAPRPLSRVAGQGAPALVVARRQATLGAIGRSGAMRWCEQSRRRLSPRPPSRADREGAAQLRSSGLVPCRSCSRLWVLAAGRELGERPSAQ
jgi:hypothetical protein